MNAISILKYLFSLIGIGLLIGAFLIYLNISGFMAEAVSAQGTVIDLVQSRSSSQRSYRPVVRFSTEDGQTLEFTSSFGSNPPGYARGDSVQVLYPPDDPQQARIHSFLALWLMPIIFAGVGGVFALIGGGLIFVGIRRQRKNAYLREFGLRIAAEFQRVERNTRLSVNGRHPYRIVCQWQNPGTSEIHLFESDNLWFDPTDFVSSSSVTVFIQRNNPKNYQVDLTFLPKLAK